MIHTHLSSQMVIANRPLGWIVLLFIPVFLLLNSSISLGNETGDPDEPVDERVLIHYWSFNNIPNNVSFSTSHPQLLDLSSRLYGALLSYDGDAWDRVNEPTPLNARQDPYNEENDRALRLRNPSGNFVLTLPTTGYEGVVFRYAVLRTSSGAHQQIVDYSIDGGESYGNTGLMDTLYSVLEDEYKLIEIDFSEIPGVDNNPDFQVRIRTAGENSEPENDSGNQRFNHITLDGYEVASEIEYDLIHHWEFNNIPNDVNFPIRTAISAGGITGGDSRINGAWIRYDGARWDRVNDPTPFNARAFVYDEEDDRALRLRNPGGDFVLRLPTTGFKDVVFSYVIKRTSGGAQGQQLTYSTDGDIFISDGLRYSAIQVGEEYIRHRIDFSDIPGVENNPDFTIRMGMSGPGSESDNDSGNHRINHITVDAVEMKVSSVFEDPDVATQFSLYQNYPNPFNPSTVIGFQIPVANHVSLKVFDVNGRLMDTIINEYKAAGTYDVTWDASHLASGVYLYKLQAGSFTETKPMMLIK